MKQIHEVDFMGKKSFVCWRSVKEWEDKLQGDRKYLKIVYLPKGLCPEYIKNF